jgi:hypothetical protein
MRDLRACRQRQLRARWGPAPKAGARHALARASDGESSCDAVVSLRTDVMGARRVAMALRGLLRRNRWRRRASVARDERRSVPAKRVPSAATKSPAPPRQQRSRGRARRIRAGTSSRIARRADAHPRPCLTSGARRLRPRDGPASREFCHFCPGLAVRVAKPRAAHRGPKGENPGACWGSPSGARGTRTPDLLGAIQAR